ncbi:ARM repeat-containing protein [Pluteus cervinus]|uniref:ARM repeat-containing protein n=1 Tax=Pluteus cervinus TaxID=181527 RepID=A0ACD3BCM9_9AGAR|nr:ARM repeat-containing protein [Pluteus cervinus]
MSAPMMATGVNVQHIVPAELYNVLLAASSQDPSQLQSSSKRLKEMLDMYGTFDALYEIASQRNIPLPVRQLAIIQFKNAALNHWRSRKVLSDDHRKNIRERALSFLDEEDESVATCNEIIVARLARNDYPSTWPNIVTDLMKIIDANLTKRYNYMNDDARDRLVLRRSLKLLGSILKELASMKMLNGVKVMAGVFKQLNMTLYNYYTTISENLSPITITAESIITEKVHTDILLAHLIYKCLMKLGIWIWTRLDKISKEEFQENQTWLYELFRVSGLQVKALVALRTVIALQFTQVVGAPAGLATMDSLTRHIRAFGKFFRRLQQLSPSRFAAIPACGDLIFFYWSQIVEATNHASNLTADSNEAVYPTRFLVQGMVLFKESLAQWAPVKRDGTVNTTSLTQEFVDNAVKLLITRFMPLNPKDLDIWSNDPEEWVNLEDKENDLWEFEIRPCSERVLMQLNNQYSQYVTPLLASTFEQVAGQPSVDLESVLQREALYCAIGRCAPKLRGVIPFDQWLERTLVAEAKSTNPNYPIIKRRIAWVIGKWIADLCTTPQNPRVWEILVHLLTDRGPGTDAVVRLSAATALKDAVASLDFVPDVFQPFLPPVVTALMALILEADTSESKTRLGLCLDTVIGECGEQIVPLANVITGPLPQLWTSAGDNWMYKGSLIVTFTKLIQALKGHSTSLNNMAVSLIREGLSIAAISFIDDDTLALWGYVMRNTLTIAGVNGEPSLLDLFPTAIELLAKLDFAAKIIKIIDSYSFLDATAVLQFHAVPLFRSCVVALSASLTTLVQKDIITSVAFFIQAAHPSLWGEALHTSGLFSFFISALLEGELPNLILTEIIYTMSRIVMIDRQLFLQLMTAVVPSTKLTEAKLYELFMDSWWGLFDSMSEPRHRKLTAMGSAALISTCRGEILERLPTETFNLWLDVFGEIKEAQAPPKDGDDNGSPNPFKRHWELDEAPRDYYDSTEETPEYERRKALYNQDPVRTVRLNTYIGNHLREAETTYGPQLFHANFLSKADPVVLKQIQDELSRP